MSLNQSQLSTITASFLPSPNFKNLPKDFFSPSMLCSTTVRAVSNTTGMWQVLKSVLICLQSSVPDIRGMTTSLSMMLGMSFCISSMASSPSEAVVT